MIKLVSQNDMPIYGNNKYILDSLDDLVNLDTLCAQGSLAFIISTGEYYMLNGEKMWKKIQYQKGVF